MREINLSIKTLDDRILQKRNLIENEINSRLSEALISAD